jgi:hypothetical protein
MVRGLVALGAPADLMPNQQARYSITAKRKPADFERGFLHVEKDGTIGMIAVPDGDILNRGFMLLRDGKATATLEWPADAPAFRLELVEAVRNPPMYQLAYSTATKAVMVLKALREGGKPILFKP